MTWRILRRLAWSAFVVWATVTIAFLVESALPSDPARMIAGAQARPQDVARIRRDMGFHCSIFVQYARFAGRLVHLEPEADGTAAAAGLIAGDPDDAQCLASRRQVTHTTCATFGPIHIDLGRSYQQRRAVTTILAERFPRTFFLAICAALVQALLGVTAGVLAAAKKRTRLDFAAVAASLLGVSAPTFVIGIFFQWLFAHRLRVLPLDGYGDTTAEHFACVILPALTLGIFGAAYYTRMVRDEMIVELGQDYVRTARAKGLSGAAVVVRHALRNALMPIVTIFGLELGGLVGGAIVTEALFRWPGIGALSVQSLLDRDGPIVMGCVILTSGAVVLSNLLVDVAYTFLDPRLRRDG
ncbi:MAG TPA: ABC transporter permease [Labilithrix sp.]|jgi:peptide/nickel transport system permease protein